MRWSRDVSCGCAVPGDGGLFPDSFRGRLMLLTAESGHEQTSEGLAFKAGRIEGRLLAPPNRLTADVVQMLATAEAVIVDRSSRSRPYAGSEPADHRLQQ